MKSSYAPDMGASPSDRGEPDEPKFKVRSTSMIALMSERKDDLAPLAKKGEELLD